MLRVDVCITNRVFELQTRNNGIDRVGTMRRKGLDGTKVLIKMREVRCKDE